MSLHISYFKIDVIRINIFRNALETTNFSLFRRIYMLMMSAKKKYSKAQIEENLTNSIIVDVQK